MPAATSANNFFIALFLIKSFFFNILIYGYKFSHSKNEFITPIGRFNINLQYIPNNSYFFITTKITNHFTNAKPITIFITKNHFIPINKWPPYTATLFHSTRLRLIHQTSHQNQSPCPKPTQKQAPKQNRNTPSLHLKSTIHSSRTPIFIYFLETCLRPTISCKTHKNLSTLSFTTKVISKLTTPENY